MTASAPLPFYAISDRGELLLRTEIEQDSGLLIQQVQALLTARDTFQVTWRCDQ